MLRDYSCQGTERNEYVSSNGIKPIEANGDTVLVEKVDARSSTLTPCSMLSKNTVKEEVDLVEHNLTNSRGNGMEGAPGSDVRGVRTRKEIADDFKDLDHVVLKERRRLLLSRCRSLFDEICSCFPLGLFAYKIAEDSFYYILSP